VRFGPSPQDPCASPLLLGSARWVAAAGLLAIALPAYASLAAASLRGFLARAAALAVLAALASAACGAALHRDYFTAVFQYPIAFLALFLYRLRSGGEAGLEYETYRSLGKTGYAVFFLFTAWIMLMGYAIATRAEPRPLESIAYNSYNALLDLALLAASRALVLRSYRTLSLRGDGAVLLDGAPIDFVLGAAGLRILRAFLSSPERRATCAEIGRGHGGEAGRGPRSPRRAGCASCAAGEVKASLCPEYRATYNRVLELKKLLEFLEVGTILPPKNKRQILAEGWRLLLFENVRLVGEGGPGRNKESGDGR